MNRLISQNVANNIVVGNLTVSNESELLAFRDALIKHGYDESVSLKTTFDDLFEQGYYCDTTQSSFVTKYFLDYECLPDGNGMVTYKNNVITNHYLNSILIFSSLLGNLDSEKYDEIITKSFIESGIFKLDSFEKIWPACLDNIIKNNELSLYYEHKFSADYLALKFALVEGLISYNVLSEISRKDISKLGALKGISVKELQQIINNSMLLTDINSLSNQKFNKIYKKVK